MAVKTLHAVVNLLSLPPCLVAALCTESTESPGSGRVTGSHVGAAGGLCKKHLSCIISDCGCAQVIDDKKAGPATTEV